MFATTRGLAQLDERTDGRAAGMAHDMTDAGRRTARSFCRWKRQSALQFASGQTLVDLGDSERE
jgi:hypothetical protein